MAVSLCAAIAATCARSFCVSTGRDCARSAVTATRRPRSRPCFKSMALAPAAMLRKPSEKMPYASSVAVVVPSPTASPVRSAASRSTCTPRSSSGSLRESSLAIVTPSLQMMGFPHLWPMRTLLDLGPNVTRTASARAVAPRRIFSRAADRKNTCLYVDMATPVHETQGAKGHWRAIGARTSTGSDRSLQHTPPRVQAQGGGWQPLIRTWGLRMLNAQGGPHATHHRPRCPHRHQLRHAGRLARAAGNCHWLRDFRPRQWQQPLFPAQPAGGAGAAGGWPGHVAAGPADAAGGAGRSADRAHAL